MPIFDFEVLTVAARMAGVSPKAMTGVLLYLQGSTCGAIAAAMQQAGIRGWSVNRVTSQVLSVCERIDEKCGHLIMFSRRVMTDPSTEIDVPLTGISVASVDTFPIRSAKSGRYSAHYKMKGYKVLVIGAHSGHILYVSTVFPITMHDTEIFRQCFPTGLPAELHGRTLGDGHFSSCPGVDTPPNLSTLRSAVCEGFEALRTTLRRVTAMSFYRARIEHRFGRSGSRLAEIYRPWNRPGGTDLAVIIRTVFILVEIRQRLNYGYGTGYKPGDEARCEEAMETNTLALARYGDALKKFADDPHPHCKCLAARRAQRRSVARRAPRPAVAYNVAAVKDRRRTLLARALASRRRSQNQFRRLLGAGGSSDDA